MSELQSYYRLASGTTFALKILKIVALMGFIGHSHVGVID